jgi:hypothetical protein
MQKWAYLFLTCEVWHGNWQPRWVQQQELPGWKSMPLDEYCDRLGDEGWELVSAQIDNIYYRFIFKRLKTPDRY